MKKIGVFLVFLFLATLAVRLFFAFQTSTFTLEAYFTQRQVESILSTGIPLYFDPLSYGGKMHLFAPLYYYLLAGFSLIMPYGIVAKIIPNIVGASIVFFSFILAKHITKDTAAALFTAFISGFIPIFFASTLNSVSPFSLLIPLLLLYAYAFLAKKTALFIMLSFVLPLIHYSAMLFPISLLFSLLISKIEGIKVEKVYVEYTVFSLLVGLWLLFILYKRAIFFHGVELFIQNVPLSVLQESFRSLTLLGVIYSIGIIPFVYGVSAAYRILFRKPNYDGFVFLSFVLTSLLLLWFGFVHVETAIIFISIFLTVMFAYYFSNLSNYLTKTRFSKLRYFRLLYIISLSTTFLITSVIPSLFLAQGVIADSLQIEEVEALEWINENIDSDAIIISSLDEGDVITAIAKRPVFIDRHFLLVEDASVRYEDYHRIFASPFKLETVKDLNGNNIRYVYITSRNPFKIHWGKFSEDCFDVVFENSHVTLLEVTCQIKTS